MFKNYLKVAFRSLNKNRVYSVINVLGLALGLTVTILVFLFVKDETNYDKDWSGYERVYRIGTKASMKGEDMEVPVSCSPMAHTLRTEFTDVETATRVKMFRQEILMRHDQTKIYIQKGAQADSTFFKVFDYEFIQGDPNTALREDNAIVLTEEGTRKLFGEKNPMGEIVSFDNRKDYIVRGVVKEPKGHSHFQFDMFLSQNRIENVWISNSWYTYVKLREGADIIAFKEKINSNFKKKKGSRCREVFKNNVGRVLFRWAVSRISITAT